MSHWTGIHWNGQELGFKVFQEVVRRLHARFDNLVWMTLSEMSRYWAAKALTRIEWQQGRVALRAPFACPRFTLRVPSGTAGGPAASARGRAPTARRSKRCGARSIWRAARGAPRRQAA